MALVCCISLITGVAFAQNTDEERLARAREAAQQSQRERQAQRELEESRKRSMDAMSDFMKDTKVEIARQVKLANLARNRQLRAQSARFRQAFSELQARGNLRQALRLENNLKAPASKLEKAGEF